MRGLPFFKPKKGAQFAGLGFSDGGGGGSSYILPTASADTLGGIKVGGNLSISGSGVLSSIIDVSTTDEKFFGHFGNKTFYYKGFVGEITNDAVDIPLTGVDGVSVYAPLSFKVLSGGNILPYGYFLSETDRFTGYYNAEDHVFRVQYSPGMTQGTFQIVLVYSKAS